MRNITCSIAYRIALVFTLLFTCVFILFTYLLPQAVIMYKKPYLIDNLQFAIDAKEDTISVDYFKIEDESFQSIIGNNREINPILLKSLQSAVKNNDYQNSLLYQKEGDVIYYYIVNKAKTGYNVAYIEDKKHFNIIHSVQITSLIVGAFLSIIFFILGTFLSKKYTAPIRLINEQVKDITSRSYRQPIILNRYDEVGELAHSIEIMRQELYSHEENQRQVFQNISHDLRTPIAVIKGYLESINDGMYEPDKINKPIEIALGEVERLNKRVSDILLLTKLESFYNEEEYINNHPLKNVIEIVVERIKIRNKNIEWELDLDLSEFQGQEDMWMIVFENILSNSIRYANNKISIKVHKGKIIIYNDGDHIPDHLIDKVFQPYEKGTSGNFGIGLAIVYRTLMNYGYKIEVTNEKIGVQFKISKKTYPWSN